MTELSTSRSPAEEDERLAKAGVVPLISPWSWSLAGAMIGGATGLYLLALGLPNRTVAALWCGVIVAGALIGYRLNRWRGLEERDAFAVAYGKWIATVAVATATVGSVLRDQGVIDDRTFWWGSPILALVSASVRFGFFGKDVERRGQARVDTATAFTIGFAFIFHDSGSVWLSLVAAVLAAALTRAAYRYRYEVPGWW